MLWSLLTVALLQAPPPPAFTEEAIQQVIESHRAEVEACLQQSIAERTAEGKRLREGAVIVRFVLTPKGKVRAASVKRSVPHSKEFHRCLVAHLMTWTFPRPDDGKLHPIEYPFTVKLQK